MNEMQRIVRENSMINDNRLMPFRHMSPCVLRFADITWSAGTHNIALKMWWGQ